MYEKKKQAKNTRRSIVSDSHTCLGIPQVAQGGKRVHHAQDKWHFVEPKVRHLHLLIITTFIEYSAKLDQNAVANSSASL